jgi:hypothetical protein
MFASDINLVPVTGRNKDRIDALSVCTALLGKRPESDPYDLNGARVNTITGRCLRLDMSNDEDRTKYADLASRCRSGDGSVELVWEEHVSTSDGGLIVYVCYTEPAKVASKLIDRYGI